MPRKRVLRPDRLRQMPPQFSWIDQRLIRDHHIERCDVHALALYMVLVTVADAQGVSYYGEGSLTRLLSIPTPLLLQARADLIRREYREIRSDSWPADTAVGCSYCRASKEWEGP
jgi:hypothetical protein